MSFSLTLVSLLAIPGLLVLGVVATGPWTLRGGGGVEFLLAWILLGLALLTAGLGARRHRALRPLSMFLLALALAAPGVMVARQRLNQRSDDQLQVCSRQLERLGQQVTDYTATHGALPATLGGCLPEGIPACPAAGTDTYSPGYRAESPGFVIVCRGDAHSRHFYDHPLQQPDYPRYSSDGGLVSRPES